MNKLKYQTYNICSRSMKRTFYSFFISLLYTGLVYGINNYDGNPIFRGNKTTVPVGTEHFSDCNPILPLWEHIPDGEPHVFEDPDKPGKYRVYIYGSDDTRQDEYCGTDLVVWSAPLEDLNNWRYDGVIYANNNYPEDPRLMFAPDVAEVVKDGVKRYYLYPNEQRAPRADVAIAESPKGPFVNLNKTGLIGFDPAVLVDDDGRVYAYWGFERSFGAELDPNTMCTLKPGTKVVEDMISNWKGDDALGGSKEELSKQFRFFEASSIRKIGHMYVFVYARRQHKSERGGGQMLAYAYSTTPLGPWTYGGPIIASPTGNIHGGLVSLNGQWYIFYHRDTNNNWYARQACVEPVEIEIKGNKIKIDEVPSTSMGFNRQGLNPYKKYPAAIACHFSGGVYAQATYDPAVKCNPLVNVVNNSVIGYRDYNFDALTGENNQLQLDIVPQGVEGTIDVMLDHPTEADGGTKLGTIQIPANAKPVLRTHSMTIQGADKIKGKHALYLTCQSKENKGICDIYYLRFVRK